jgi:hypothetical protein
MDGEYCVATTKAGEPCKARAQPGSTFCLAHDPARIADLAEWRRKGGEGKRTANRLAKKLPREARDVLDTLAGALAAVERGEMAPPVAHALATLARAWGAIYETAEVDRRIGELETAIEAQQTERAG